ncbi:hypothetical protein JOE30_001441 [Rhodococcus sp. PvP016]|uniref:Uncharacterized protein n=1 Tax=Rhodococcoides corynebacterioides TaxID=53972 RepID=A0ABS2KZM3_9NOCA|nr:hypothetical protein [Rhodococcus corynebacterioides]MBP1115644.1 hypothetical protein [Rhodococcus sp. PvP016]
MDVSEHAIPAVSDTVSGAARVTVSSVVCSGPMTLSENRWDSHPVGNRDVDWIGVGEPLVVSPLASTQSAPHAEAFTRVQCIVQALCANGAILADQLGLRGAVRRHLVGFTSVEEGLEVVIATPGMLLPAPSIDDGPE